MKNNTNNDNNKQIKMPIDIYAAVHSIKIYILSS